MKYLLLIPGLLCLGCSVLNAQSNNEASLAPVINEIEYYIKDIESEFYRISKVEIDLVHSSGSTYTPVKLTAGRTYNVFLVGERNRIMDIDLKIHEKPNDDWVLAKHENTSTNIVKTTFTPGITGYFDFEVITERFYSSYTVGRYSLIISY